MSLDRLLTTILTTKSTAAKFGATGSAPILFTVRGRDASFINSISYAPADSIGQAFRSHVSSYGYNIVSGSGGVNWDRLTGATTITCYINMACGSNIANAVANIRNIVSNAGILREVTASATPSGTACSSGVASWGGNTTATGTGNTTASGGNYTVKSGDTLGKIASANSTTVAAIMALNPQIKNANNISVGQVIKLSGTASGSGTWVTPKPTGTTNTNTGNNPPVVVGGNTPVTQPVADNRSVFDKVFFDGAGVLSATGIGILIVLGAVVVTKSR